MPKRINWRIVRSNLDEARQELERLEKAATKPNCKTGYTLE
jgi:5-bromo-4-chloroindolyl phosphate hydrolysis protein